MRKPLVWFVLAVVLQLVILAAVPARKYYASLTGTLVVLQVAPVDPYDIMSGYYMTLAYEINRPGLPTRRPWREPQTEPATMAATVPAGTAPAATTATAPASARPAREPTAPWQDLPDGTTVFVVLKPDAGGIWRAQSVLTARPSPPPAGCAVIRGTVEGSWRIDYGIETFYFPEAVRDKINDDLRQHPRDARVEVKVDRFGNAVLEKLLVQDRVYEY